MDTKPDPLLFHAIERADIDTLRHVLKSMCLDSTECSTTAATFLLIQKGQLSSDDELQEGIEGRGKGKRGRNTKRTKLTRKFTGVKAERICRYETCAVCKERFDLTTNHPKACEVHPGYLDGDDAQIGWDKYDDKDEITSWLSEEAPELFTWTCCKGDGVGGPCYISKHVVK